MQAQRQRLKEKQAAQPDQPYSDSDGHFIVRLDKSVSDWRNGGECALFAALLLAELGTDPVTLLFTDVIKKQLGQGTFGKVVQCQKIQDGKQYAVKIM